MRVDWASSPRQVPTMKYRMTAMDTDRGFKGNLFLSLHEQKAACNRIPEATSVELLSISIESPEITNSCNDI